MVYWKEETTAVINGKRKRVTKKRLAFGIIQNMYYHSLWPTTNEPRVLISCIWYQYYGINPANGLVQVRRHKRYDEDCSVCFLSDCVSIQSVLWPSHPFASTQEEKDEFMDVMLHHDPFPEFDRD